MIKSVVLLFGYSMYRWLSAPWKIWKIYVSLISLIQFYMKQNSTRKYRTKMKWSNICSLLNKGQLQIYTPCPSPRCPPNFAPGVKTKLKDFSGEILQTNKFTLGQLIFHRGAEQKLCLKYAQISWNMLLLWPKSKVQGKHLTI